jgi:hypothetical protein
VLLVSICFSGVVFVALDYVYTRAALRSFRQKLEAQLTRSVATGNRQGNCRAGDPERHHVLKPNCATIDHWGPETYELFTNNLGFRDDRVREIPRADVRPRVLMLGDSFTEGKIAWDASFAGRISAHFPQYDFLNGGVTSYSPSNYFNVATMTLASGVEVDEVIVFIDISDAQDEAAYYRDSGAGHAVKGPEQSHSVTPLYARFRQQVNDRLLLTSHIFEFFERSLVKHGFYHLDVVQGGNIFDLERSAWTYRQVSDTERFDSGYAPLGLERGIGKEEEKMTLLWETLAQRHIPISVVVYPWPAQMVHDTADSRQERVWKAWCAGKCKRFISLFPAFFGAKAHCSWIEPGCWYPDLYLFGDYHFSAAGNAIVANAVIDNLESTHPTKALPMLGLLSAK